MSDPRSIPRRLATLLATVLVIVPLGLVASPAAGSPP